ncbi:uncharacterized protein LOC127794273 [Diospyros lotus]|uniref:uncharacterized protein LOC127794273 n=1 Tax=Diospyros lotus TaxID=55363 RepID=UPI00224F62DE|nr:uncharacterized protein LOC127794273 [Diospyros lotus]
MYIRRKEDGYVSTEFIKGVEKFVNFAKSQPEWMDGNKIKCPCNQPKCRNTAFRDQDTVTSHLLTKGFVPGYYEWTLHGEVIATVDSVDMSYSASTLEAEPSNLFETMVMDAAGPDFNPNMEEEPPNPEAQAFYDMLSAAKKELYPGCQKHSQLSLVSRLLSFKSEHHLSERGFNQLCELLKEVLPEPNTVIDNFYSTKKLVRGLGLPVEKIDCCRNNCMIFWGDDSDLTVCKFCHENRYKQVDQADSSKRQKTCVPYKKMHYFPLTPRLLRLYASNSTAAEMRWHADHVVEDGVMRHPSDSPAWIHFNQTHREFAAEKRNVRLGLCTDGFQPFGQSGKQYSCWPVIVTVYNLPPWMCMKDTTMFLTVLVPGPENPKAKLDVFLQPLIAELKHLWDVGVHAYDISLKQNFQLRAALMWTISDFPAYSMLSGYSTAGKLACPYCTIHSDAFYLSKSRKISWFDNHRKFLHQDHPYRRNRYGFRKNTLVKKTPPPVLSGPEILASLDELGLVNATQPNAAQTNADNSHGSGWKSKSIFWDLPYWKTQLIRHNLDVMHIEKNVFENVFNTVMNVPGKTKDTVKSREELNQYCRRITQSTFTLNKKEKAVLCAWVKNLKFPDGYVSNMARCVDTKKLKLFGMKSHDCHVFMQRLVPVAFRELLPQKVWEALTELSLFFKDLTSTTIKSEHMMKLENDIPITLCKLELIFPPSFFDSMEHLPIHLAYEARIAGPVQYRWMYPFERYLGKLKKTVRNKARVEGSISNSYVVEEASLLCSHYFEDHVVTRHTRVPRNDAGVVNERDDQEGKLSIFKHPCRPFGCKKSRMLFGEEYDVAHRYILMNCPEVEPYLQIYDAELRQRNLGIGDHIIEQLTNKEFPSWFNNYARDPTNNVTNSYIRDLAKGPFNTVTTYPGCFVNGFKFHTISHGSNKGTMNSGMCVKGSNYDDPEKDYYGRITEIVELEYPSVSSFKKVVLFKGDWFIPTLNEGVKIHHAYKIVEVNEKKKWNTNEQFVLASQAIQVYFCEYPSLRRNKSDWLVVTKVKPRFIVEVPQSFNNQEATLPREALPYQEDDVELHDIAVDDAQILETVNDGDHADLNDEPVMESEFDEAPELNDEQVLRSDSEDKSESYDEQVLRSDSEYDSESEDEQVLQLDSDDDLESNDTDVDLYDSD